MEFWRHVAQQAQGQALGQEEGHWWANRTLA